MGGGLDLYSKSSSAYILNGSVGIQSRYMARNGSIFFSLDYEYMLTNTQDNIAFMLESTNPQTLLFQTPIKQRVSFALGGDVSVGRNALLGLEGFYTNSFFGISYYGANASFRYVF